MRVMSAQCPGPEVMEPSVSSGFMDMEVVLDYQGARCTLRTCGSSEVRARQMQGEGRTPQLPGISRFRVLRCSVHRNACPGDADIQVHCHGVSLGVKEISFKADSPQKDPIRCQ